MYSMMKGSKGTMILCPTIQSLLGGDGSGEGMTRCLEGEECFWIIECISRRCWGGGGGVVRVTVVCIPSGYFLVKGFTVDITGYVSGDFAVKDGT